MFPFAAGLTAQCSFLLLSGAELISATQSSPLEFLHAVGMQTPQFANEGLHDEITPVHGVRYKIAFELDNSSATSVAERQGELGA